MTTTQHDNTTESWITIHQTAAHLGVSVGFLRRGVRLGKVTFARADSKALRFRRSALDRWLLESNGSAGEVTYAERSR